MREPITRHREQPRSSLGRRALLGCELLTLAGLVASLVSMAPAGGSTRQTNEKLRERANRAGEIVAELVKEADHAPPQSLLNKATCVAAVPGVVQVGLGVGGKVGFGLASCRTSAGWSLPTFMGLKGGTWGLQIGGQSADVVLLFLNRNAPRLIASSSFDLGGQASVAAGPVGRNLSAETDYKLSAEIYSYSKTKGLFAGINLAGTKWEVDSKANRAVYGESRAGNVKRLLRSSGTRGPTLVQPFLRSLQQNVAH
jgi:SH3 domain-containing YSC84-like protein 1